MSDNKRTIDQIMYSEMEIMQKEITRLQEENKRLRDGLEAMNALTNKLIKDGADQIELSRKHHGLEIKKLREALFMVSECDNCGGCRSKARESLGLK